MFRTQDESSRGSQDTENVGVRVRIALGRNTWVDPKSRRNLRSMFRPDSRFTLCALGAPDTWGAPGAEYYFCWWERRKGSKPYHPWTTITSQIRTNSGRSENPTKHDGGYNTTRRGVILNKYNTRIKRGTNKANWLTLKRRNKKVQSKETRDLPRRTRDTPRLASPPSGILQRSRVAGVSWRGEYPIRHVSPKEWCSNMEHTIHGAMKHPKMEYLKWIQGGTPKPIPPNRHQRTRKNQA